MRGDGASIRGDGASIRGDGASIRGVAWRSIALGELSKRCGAESNRWGTDDSARGPCRSTKFGVDDSDGRDRSKRCGAGVVSGWLRSVGPRSIEGVSFPRRPSITSLGSVRNAPRVRSVTPPSYRGPLLGARNGESGSSAIRVGGVLRRGVVTAFPSSRKGLSRQVVEEREPSGGRATLGLVNRTTREASRRGVVCVGVIPAAPS